VESTATPDELPEKLTKTKLDKIALIVEQNLISTENA
jgi:hypothetical protein